MRRLLAVLLATLSLASILAACSPGDPFGVLESVDSSIFGIRVTGWVTDTSNPERDVTIHVYVDDQRVAAGRTTTQRKEIARAIPSLGTAHGYDIVAPLPARAGRHRVCVYALNTGPGRNNPQLGCKSVSSNGHNPSGSFDRLHNDGTNLTLTGWAIDPDTSDAVSIHTYVGGKFLQSSRANDYSANLARFLGDTGARRGFRIVLPNQLVLAETICIFAINSGAGGTNPLLGCRKRPIPTATADGNIEVSVGIVDNVSRLVAAARRSGLALSGSGFRTHEEQIAFRRQNCGTSRYAVYSKPSGQCSPPTAIPGRSMHEIGEAIDFRCNGRGMGSRSSPCYGWLARNAAAYGLYNLPSEPWHWSTNGS